ncbi:MAG: hypothetical protein ABJP34_12955 [Erythrobacter sp.]
MKTPKFPALILLASSSSLAFLPAQLHAQNVGSEANAAEEDGEGEIIVQAQRLRGQLDVEQAPVLELNEEDIRATGATSIAELIETISPQTTSSRGRGGGGRPVFLVNGVRIGSFRELRSYPPEAIVKVEVMPEEVAQKFGFPPDRRVVNLILKENYSSREIEAEYEQPSQGGYRAGEGEFTLLRINKNGRTNFNVEVEERTLLTEADRDIIQTPGSVSDVVGDPDQALFRSLINDRFAFEVSGNWAKTYLDSGSSVSLNTTYEREEQNGLSGLNTALLTAPDGTSALRTLDAANPLEVRTTTDTISSAGSWTQPVGTFRLNTTFDASVTDNVREIDRRGDTSALVTQAAAGTLAIDGALPSLADAGFDTALTETISAEAKSVLRGVLLDLPAGEFSTTFDVGYGWDRITSSDTRSGADAQLTRGDVEGGVNVVIPLTSRRNFFADALGSFTLNGQAGFNHYSDFGTLYDWSAGLNWSPFDSLNLQATYVFNESVPSLSALGAPQTTTLNVPVFDFVNGETVLATVISGGNPNLLAETQKDWKFSASWELPFWDNTRLSGEYIVNRSEDVTGGFPALTAQVEAAFPGRVTRDAGGTLLSLDRRQVTYANSRSKSLVFGLTTRGSWGAARPSGGAQGGRPQGSRPQGGRPAGAGRPEGRPAGAARPGGRGGPPSAERREQFMAFRMRLCADDGMEMLNKLVAAVDNGEDVSAIIPGFNPERLTRMLDRARGEDGKIDSERLAQFRERICSMDPSQMRGGGGPPQQASGGGRPAGARGGGRRGGRSPFGGGDGRGRYFFNLNHTIALQSEVQIIEGGFVFDNLAGDALSNTGFARHTTRLEAGAFRNGFGVRLSGRYTGKARINGNAATGTSPLFFGDLATFNLRLFTNLGQVLKKDDGVFKNLRLSLRADNVFDARRRVVDENGDVPITFQPDLLDPTGRYVGIQLRKLF